MTAYNFKSKKEILIDFSQFNKIVTKIIIKSIIDN